MGVTTLQGEIHTWEVDEGGGKREYIVVTEPYGRARTLFKSDPYSAATGKGEQRAVVESHARKLRREMEAGKFTVSTYTVGLRPWHAKALTYQGEGASRHAVLVVEEQDSLPMLDGGHRFDAIRQIREEAEKSLKKAAEGEEKEKARRRLERVDALPITTTVLLDGDPQTDFLNLQKGKAVDAAHMFSLKVSRNTDPADKNAAALKLAFNVAKLLHTNKDCDFYKQVRFDSKGFAPYPVSSLCSKGSSDLGTSLLGLARVGLARGKAGSPEWLAYAVVGSAKALHESAPELLGPDRVLTPPPDGTRGAASLLIGLGVAMAYRMSLEDSALPTPRDLAQLVAAARKTLDREVKGNFSGPAKRGLFGSFVCDFFRDLDVPKHEGIPLGLISILSASAFGVSPLPKPAKKGGMTVPEAPHDAEEAPPSDAAYMPEAKTDDFVVAAAESLCPAEQGLLPEPPDTEDLDIPGVEGPEPEPADVACVPGPPDDDAPVGAMEGLCPAEQEVVPGPEGSDGTDVSNAPEVTPATSARTPQCPGCVVADVTNHAKLDMLKTSFQDNYGEADQTLCLVANGGDVLAVAKLVESWGYEYKTVLTILAESKKGWVQYCVVAVRGRPPVTTRKIPDVIREKSPQRRDELVRMVGSTYRRAGLLFIPNRCYHRGMGCNRLDERRLAG
jgi:hypothetical protein